ncbi:MAG: ABC transporter transmembrane domain-containing protein [Lachnospiraceae bacterium]|nr:ABC transporter transmembrane domain-containing protein [Lachnospiraceae bacterium]
MGALRKLISKIGIWRKYLFLLLLRSPFDALMTCLCANLMKSVFGYLERNDADALLKHCVIYGLLCAALFVYNGTIWTKYAAFSAKVEILLQKKMFEKMLSMPLQRIDSRFNGEWMTRLNSDIQTAFTMMNGPLNMPHLIVAVINITLSCYLMQKSSLLFLGITWISAIPPFIINDRIVLKTIPKLKEESQRALAENTSAIKPLLTDADTILLYAAQELMMKNCAKTSRKLLKINMKTHIRKAISDAGMCFFGISGYLMILLIGYQFIYHGRMAFSDIVYCFQVRGSILTGTLMLMTCLNNLKANAVCVNRILETLEE